MKLIFMYGPPGVGKLTVAQELAHLTGYKLFHNHLAVDLVYAVFDFKTKPFVELREIIWMLVFQKAKEERVQGLIFTFAPEESVPDHFIPDVTKLIEDDQDTILFVELTCDPEELKRRIVTPSRSRYSKGMKADHIEKYYQRDYLIPASVHKERSPSTIQTYLRVRQPSGLLSIIHYCRNVSARFDTFVISSLHPLES